MSSILCRSLTLPEVNRSEVLRYAGIRCDGEEFLPLIDECIRELEGAVAHTVVYGEFPLRIGGNEVDLGFVKLRSSDLAKNLRGCTAVVAFGATVGLSVDRMITKYGVLRPAKALFMQSLGAERVEALCDAFCQGLREEKEREGLALHPRFSPGYGDCPLSLQKDLIRVLDAPKRIGLTVNESLLLSPAKSVTALVGIEKK